jgi:hypothetical protein
MLAVFGQRSVSPIACWLNGGDRRGSLGERGQNAGEQDKNRQTDPKAPSAGEGEGPRRFSCFESARLHRLRKNSIKVDYFERAQLYYLRKTSIWAAFCIRAWLQPCRKRDKTNAGL